MAAFFQRGNPKQPLPSLSTNKSSQKPSEKSFTKQPSVTPTNSISNDRKSSSTMPQVINSANTQKLRREPAFSSSTTIISHRKSTGNIMLLGHLQNLKQQRIQNDQKSMEKKGRVLMGNIVKQPSIVRGHMLNKLDPDVLNSIGNEHYRHGRFREAVVLYNQAIDINPRNACYYSNKSAALMSLGRLIEGVIECREAIRLDHLYHNAQYRLARLYLRLGEAEKAIDHYEQYGLKVNERDIAEAQDLKRSICNCIEARRMRDYKKLLKETQSAISFGADSAPQIFSMRAEALMKLHRHEEAYTTIQKGLNFGTHLYRSLFGSAKTAYLLIIQAQVYTTVGRFEDGINAAQEAAKLVLSDEIITVLRRINGLASARLKGNELFKELKYAEACNMYTEGLEGEPYNSILLFNRSACRFKMGQFERAVEDCTAALLLRPSYTKARFKRATCYIKLERWEAAIQDCEMLLQEKAGDEEVRRALVDASIQLQREREDDQNQRNVCSRSILVLVASN